MMMQETVSLRGCVEKSPEVRDKDWEHHEVNTELILMEELVMKLLMLVERLLETRWESW